MERAAFRQKLQLDSSKAVYSKKIEKMKELKNVIRAEDEALLQEEVHNRLDSRQSTDSSGGIPSGRTTSLYHCPLSYLLVNLIALSAQKIHLLTHQSKSLNSTRVTLLKPRLC